MKYIIMCGGNYPQFEKPKQLLEVAGEVLVERTIRLLKENGVNDIAISTNNPAFDYLEIEKIRHKNNYFQNDGKRNSKSSKSWLNAYCPIEEPACYLHGDCYYSEECIKTIIATPVKNTMFFAVPDRNDGRKNRNIKGREPLAYKVENQQIFREAINKLFKMIDEGKFISDPISWNLYRQLNGIKLDFNGYGNGIFDTKGDFIAIDDYSTDIDSYRDIPKLELLLKELKGEIKMIKVEAIADFYLGRFNEIQNMQRRNRNEDGKIFKGDVFECNENLADYLVKDNSLKRPFVKVIEVIPEKVTNKIEIPQEITENQNIEDTAEIIEKPKRKTTRRKK